MSASAIGAHNSAHRRRKVSALSSGAPSTSRLRRRRPTRLSELARELGIADLIIPPEPGNFSALGMILSGARVDDTQTFLRPLDAPESIAEMKQIFAQRKVEHFIGLGAEWWFNSSSYP